MFIVNVEAAIHKNGRWLIIKRSEKEEHAAGMLALAGGKVDADESSKDTLENALKREVSEEISLDVSNFRYVQSGSFVSGSGNCVIDVVFLCDYVSGEPTAVSADEVAGIYWMTTQEVLDNPNSPDYLKEQVIAANSVIRTAF